MNETCRQFYSAFVRFFFFFSLRPAGFACVAIFVKSLRIQSKNGTRSVHIPPRLLSAIICADRLGGDVLGCAMQPGGKDDRAAGKLDGAPGQSGESPLGHILCKVRIASHAQGGRVHEIDVTENQLGESRFAAALGVIND